MKIDKINAIKIKTRNYKNMNSKFLSKKQKNEFINLLKRIVKELKRYRNIISARKSRLNKKKEPL